MIIILCWGVFTLGLLIFGIPVTESYLECEINGWFFLTIMARIVSLIWCIVIINIISSDRHTQMSKILQLDQEKEKKVSYKSQLDDYITSLKSVLVDDYRDFEKALMDSVKDSNLLAAYMKDSSYSRVLSEYSSTIKRLQEFVYNCDRSISQLTRQITLEKNDIWKNGLFIPGLPKSSETIRMDDK